MKSEKILATLSAPYRGINKKIWWLSMIMLINRTGAMVFPFLSIYLTKHLHFGELKTGWILSTYGLGSMVGTLFGGWFSDRFGNFKIQAFSLIFAGIGWIIISHVTNYHTLLGLVFFQTMISESLRPANSSAIASMADPATLTKSYSLNRMAINLGFSLGPALAGFLATISYTLLFYVDGSSNILSGIIFLIVFNRELRAPYETGQQTTSRFRIRRDGPLFDRNFLIFCILTILFATVFFQLLFTLPLFYKEAYSLSDSWIGGLLAINGVIVFVSEMFLVHYLNNRVRHVYLILLGVFLVGISFLFLNLFQGIPWLFLSVVLISYGEIFSMPFMMTYTSNKSNEKNRGRYMAFYSLAYSISLILAPFIGMRVIKYYSFAHLWYLVSVLTIFQLLGFYLVMRKDRVAENLT
jgi:predicted MFS family arabinose efflux permease